MFFDKLCTISSVTYTIVWGFQKRVYADLYVNIPCNFELNRDAMKWTNLWENVDMPKYVIVLPIEYKNVRENQTIELTDPILWTLGQYIISRVSADPSIGGYIDCITLYAQEMKWQQP